MARNFGFAHIRRPSQTCVLQFFRQLATMIASGIPLLRALEIAEQRGAPHQLQAAIATMRATLLDGGTIAEGLKSSPYVFKAEQIHLISAGERAGTLDESLRTICDNMERSRALNNRMVAVATYPSIVLITLVAVKILLLTFVIPTFEELFRDSGVPLPWLTERVIALSHATLNHSGLLGFLTLAFLGLIIAALRAPQSRVLIHTSLFSLPLIKTLLKKHHAAHCTRLLASFVRTGVPLLEAVEITHNTIINRHAARDLMEIHSRLWEGLSLSESFRLSKTFPPLVSHMVAIGEETGQLEDMLRKTAALFEEELESLIEKLQQAAQPCLILAIGAIVGTLVLAMYLPIFDLGKVARIG